MMSTCDVALGAAETLPQSRDTSTDQISMMLPAKVSPPHPAEIVLPRVDSMDTAVHQRLGSNAGVDDEGSPDARIERLGRAMPPQFKSLGAEIGFVFSIAMSQVLTVSMHLIPVV